MLIKNKSLSLLAKIAFCVVSFYGIIAAYRSISIFFALSNYVSPITSAISWSHHKLCDFTGTLLNNSDGITNFIIAYISDVFLFILSMMNFIVYGTLYAMLAQKIFFGDAFKKEYYKPRNFFNIYTKLVVILYLLIPFTDDMIFYIWRNYPNIKSFLLFIWQKKSVQTGEIYAMLTVFLVYKAIGLARKKSQAAPLQTAAI